MKILNILNGTVMLEHFKKLGNIEGELVSFNEAMCDGEVSSSIFSSDFVDERSVYHLISREDYEENVVDILNPLLSKSYEKLVLWFDKDMFCQINLLTILAYLDQNEVYDDVILNYVDEKFEVEKCVVVKPKSFYSIYVSVLVCKHMPKIALPPILKRGVELYLEYSLPENDITDFIIDNIEMPEDELVAHLFKNFKEYGLGDVQYFRLIDYVKENFESLTSKDN
ncbi:MAG: AraC family transcriptional regulator [Clostridia bacterium]